MQEGDASEGRERKTNEKIMSLGSGQEQRLSKTFVGANRRAGPGLQQIVHSSGEGSRNGGNKMVKIIYKIFKSFNAFFKREKIYRNISEISLHFINIL